jgi:hypothetical protein
MIGMPIDPDEPKSVTTAEVEAAAARARITGEWGEVAKLQKRPRLLTAEEVDQILAAPLPDKHVNGERNY